MFKNLKAAAKSKVTEAASELDFKAITKGYTLETESVSSGGHQCLWRAYPAVRESTGEQVTVHIMEKKVGKDVVEWAKVGVRQMVKVVHPSILRVVEQVREKGAFLMYVSERVKCSLEDALDGAGFDLTEIERKIGLFQLAEGVSFLHSQVGVLHLNLTPANLYLTHKKEFKIAGFDFSVHRDGSRAVNGNFQKFSGGADAMFGASIDPLKGPELSYAHPDYVSQKLTVTQKSDVFSYGCVVHEVLQSSRGHRVKLIDCHSDVASYNMKISELTTSSGQSLSPTVKSAVVTRGVTTITDLLTASDGIFAELSVRCLMYLPRYPEKDASAKRGFCKDIYSIVATYPPSTITRKVIPILAEDLYHPQMQSFILPILLKVVDVLSQAEFTELLLEPHFAKLMSGAGVQTAVLFLEKIQSVAGKMTPKQREAHLLPFIAGQLETNVSKGLITVVCGLCKDHQFFDERGMDKVVVPRLAALAGNFRDGGVRALCFEVLGKLGEVIGAENMGRKVVPGVVMVLKGEKDPQVVQAIGTFFTNAASSIPLQMVASSVIPQLSTALSCAALPLPAHRVISNTIRQLLDRLDAAKNAPPPVRPATPPAQIDRSWAGDLAKPIQAAEIQFSGAVKNEGDPWAAFAVEYGGKKKREKTHTHRTSASLPTVSAPVVQQQAFPQAAQAPQGVVGGKSNSTMATLDDLFGAG